LKHALIFDLDGTLWDPVPTLMVAWNEAVAFKDPSYRRLTQEEIESVMGLSPEGIREALFGDVSEEIGKGLVRECLVREVIHLGRKEAKLYPKVREGLATLSEHYGLFLVSNCEYPYLQTFFKVSHLEKQFKDSECLGRTKRDKALNIQAVMKRNDLRSATYVGDTERDATAAAAAGTDFAFVTYGYGKKNCDHLSFDSFGALTDYFVKRSKRAML
jgi:phosphoglycolate phosphatase